MGISLLIKIALVGLIAWVITELVPMPAHIKKVIIIVAVVIAVLLALPLVEQLFASL